MIAADHLAYLLGKPLIEVCTNGELIAQGLLKAKEIYNPAFLIVFSDVSVETEAMGVELDYYEDRNPHPKNNLKPEDFRNVNMANSGRLPELFKAAEICRREVGEEFPIFFSLKDPFSLAAMVAGTENFLMSIIDSPEKPAEMIDICLDNQIGLIDNIIQNNYIPFIGAPIASGSLIGGNNFRKFALPVLKVMFDFVWKNGSSTCIHICGSIIELMDSLSLLKPDLLSFEDSSVIARWELLPKTVPMGYIPTELFVRGNVESVRESSMRCLHNLPKPCVLSTGCDIPAKSNPELMKVFMNS